MNANEVLANRAAEILGAPLGKYDRVHPNDHVNMGQSTNDVFPTATRLALLFAVDGVLSAARESRERPREQERRVRRDSQDRQDASPGRGADHARTGVRRVRRERVARGRGSRAHRRAAARVESRRHRRRHGPQRRRRLHERGRRESRALYGASPPSGRQPLPRHAEHGRRARVLGRRAPAGGRGQQDRLGSPALEHGPARRHRRNPASGRTARIVHHARQGESVCPRDGESGWLSGDRLRRGGPRRRATPDSSS